VRHLLNSDRAADSARSPRRRDKAGCQQGSLIVGGLLRSGRVWVFWHDLSDFPMSTSLTSCGCVLWDWQGDVQMKKVNYDAKLEHDMIKNYKVLQCLFDKRQVTKVLYFPPPNVCCAPSPSVAVVCAPRCGSSL